MTGLQDGLSYNRVGLRHMLVILYTRHEDNLFSKIKKFASLTNWCTTGEDEAISARPYQQARGREHARRRGENHAQAHVAGLLGGDEQARLAHVSMVRGQRHSGHPTLALAYCAVHVLLNRLKVRQPLRVVPVVQIVLLLGPGGC
jgi:hypothetical protein